MYQVQVLRKGMEPAVYECRDSGVNTSADFVTLVNINKGGHVLLHRVYPRLDLAVPGALLDGGPNRWSVGGVPECVPVEGTVFRSLTADTNNNPV